MSHGVTHSGHPGEAPTSSADRPRPWLHARAAALWPVASESLPYSEAERQPCGACATSVCCTLVSLKQLKVTTAHDLDYLSYVLNFDRMEVGAAADGSFSIYYRWRCRHLVPESLGCGVHKTARQPKTCVYYRAHTCWYRTAIGTQERDSFVRLDRATFDRFLELVTVASDGQIVAIPSWADMLALRDAARDGAHADPPPETPAPEPPTPMPWEPGAPAPRRVEIATGLQAFRQDPCSGCEAACCTHLAFPAGKPSTAMGLDFFRYVLGFEDLEIGVADDQCWFFVRTTCRAFDRASRLCTLFGKPERPGVCTSLDGRRCGFRDWFLSPAPRSVVRVRYEQFDTFASLFRFDEGRRVTSWPTLDELRGALGAPLPTALTAAPPAPTPELPA
ncbi:MAG: hypothetical protein IT385_03830 [Deltaproteobacteria bacterium]|nr:hypothetical protein [Deltaproteobacteria bacterium]